MDIQEPTSEQCSGNELVYDDQHRAGYAIWYPQMGGYVGKAVALIDKFWYDLESGARIGGCVDVLVWHDGDFPFHDGERPIRIHHCDPEQFVDFGKKLAEMNEKWKR